MSREISMMDSLNSGTRSSRTENGVWLWLIANTVPSRTSSARSTHCSGQLSSNTVLWIVTVLNNARPIESKGARIRERTPIKS